MAMMALKTLNGEINEARSAYLEVRGYLREDSELNALDGVYNALKSPQRLRIDQAEASVDQKCESIEYMITSLHRVLDLMCRLWKLCSKRTEVESMQVDCAIKTLKEAPNFLYCQHFTNAVKHTVYIRRGLRKGKLFFDGFAYKNRGKQIQQRNMTEDQILEAASDVISLSTNLMRAMSQALKKERTFDSNYSQVCATPIIDPNLNGLGVDRED